MLTQLQLQGLDDQTIVVVTSNHGQEFNETQSNSWGYDSNYSTYQVQVPWCWPGLVPNPAPGAGEQPPGLVPTPDEEHAGCTQPPS